MECLIQLFLDESKRCSQYKNIAHGDLEAQSTKRVAYTTTSASFIARSSVTLPFTNSITKKLQYPAQLQSMGGAPAFFEL